MPFCRPTGKKEGYTYATSYITIYLPQATICSHVVQIFHLSRALCILGFHLKLMLLNQIRCMHQRFFHQQDATVCEELIVNTNKHLTYLTTAMSSDKRNTANVFKLFLPYVILTTIFKMVWSVNYFQILQNYLVYLKQMICCSTEKNSWIEIKYLEIGTASSSTMTLHYNENLFLRYRS